MTALDHVRSMLGFGLAGDPHLAAAARALSAAADKAMRRRAERLFLGCCPCGLAPGEAHCPICDGHMGTLGRSMREEGQTLAEITESERRLVALAATGGHSPGELVDLTVLLNARFETDADRAARAERARLRGAEARALATKVTAACAAPKPGCRPQNRAERRAERSRRRG